MKEVTKRLLKETNMTKSLKRPHEGTMSPREWTFLNRRPCHGIKKVASLLHFILKWHGNHRGLKLLIILHKIHNKINITCYNQLGGNFYEDNNF